MDVIDGFDNPMEQMLVNRASAMHVPIGGAMELLPLCNMDCKMCYIRLSKAEMEAQGRMLTCDEWLRIAEEAKASGTLFLLLTGGEPLLYPEFERLYTTLSTMGFVLSVNTNGTLLDEHWADLFAARPCRRLNITLYGPDDATYGKLCGNPHGFSQVMRAVELLNERNVPFRFNYSATRINRPYQDAIIATGLQNARYIASCYYMFPPVQKEREQANPSRMTPEEAAEAVISGSRVRNGGTLSYGDYVLPLLKATDPPKFGKEGKMHCRGGVSSFWMNWKGELLPCGMFDEPKMSLLEHSFQECWEYAVQETAKIHICEACVQCKKQNICDVCAAACYLETGSFPANRNICAA